MPIGFQGNRVLRKLKAGALDQRCKPRDGQTPVGDFRCVSFSNAASASQQLAGQGELEAVAKKGAAHLFEVMPEGPNHLVGFPTRHSDIKSRVFGHAISYILGSYCHKVQIPDWAIRQI